MSPIFQKAALAAAVLWSAVAPLAAQAAGADRAIWSGSGDMIYDLGFSAGLMRHPLRSVRLFDMVLVQNDAPGTSRSDQGVNHDVVWGPYRAKKIPKPADARTRAARLLFCFCGRPGRHPLCYRIHGHEGQVKMWDPEKDFGESYRWVQFPGEWLRKGENAIELFSPEAFSEERGWDLHLDRADESLSGGGGSAPVDKTSLISFIGGKTWRQSPFGQDERTWAEYDFRLSLDRCVLSGWLATPVIDLWKGGDGFIVPLAEILRLEVRVEADVSPGTDVEHFLHKASDPSPFSPDWSSHVAIGSGLGLSFTVDGFSLNRRDVQIPAVLPTENLRVTPVGRSAEITVDLLKRMPRPANLHRVSVENPGINHFSIDWEREFWVNLFLAGLLIAPGWQAKFTETVGHELIEVWNDDFGKWVCPDATNGSGACTSHMSETGEPLSLYELHRLWLDQSFPNRPIDWMMDRINWPVPAEGEPFPVSRGSRSYPASAQTESVPFLTGCSNAARLKAVTRNTCCAKPTPRPLTHSQPWWPWDSYLNRYDERTPRNRRYSWHTDRPRDLCSDLNPVHIDATTSFGNDRLFLHFETPAPDFDRFEAVPNGDGRGPVPLDWTWFLDSGRNTSKVVAVSKLGVRGKPVRVSLNLVDRPLGEWGRQNER